MTVWLIILISIISIIIFYLYVCLIVNRIVLCNKNNALGIVLLCITLDIIPGIILGLSLIYNVRQKENKQLLEALKTKTP